MGGSRFYDQEQEWIYLKHKESMSYFKHILIATTMINITKNKHV
jgi:hypothetical protein